MMMSTKNNNNNTSVLALGNMVGCAGSAMIVCLPEKVMNKACGSEFCLYIIKELDQQLQNTVEADLCTHHKQVTRGIVTIITMSYS